MEKTDFQDIVLKTKQTFIASNYTVLYFTDFYNVGVKSETDLQDVE